MTSGIAARIAHSADADVVQRLATAARHEVTDQRGGVQLLAFDQRARLPIDDGLEIVVGLIDGAVVGYAGYAIVERDGVRVLFLADLYVDPRAREVGVAAAMLAAVEAIGDEQRCTHLESEVLPGNRAAKNFFERMGMVTRKMRVSRPFG